MERYLDKIFEVSQIKKEPDIQYSFDPLLLLNGYHITDDTEKKKPCILWCHGGGGTRMDMEGKCEEFAQRGYVTISIDYRGTGGNFTIENQKIAVSDLWSAIRWVRINAKKLKIDPDKIFTGGVSAGALTALQANICANNLDDPFFDDDDLNMSNGEGPVDVVASATISGAASGTFYDLIDEGDSPNFFHNGEQDTKIYFSQAVKTFNKMVEEGIESTMMSFPELGHGLGSKNKEINDDIAQHFYNLLQQL